LFRKSFCAEQSSVVIQNRLFDVLASLIARREPMPSSAVIDDLSRSPPISSIGTVWQLFTDRVMGGVSNGTLVRELVAGRPVIRMRGDVRLEHNGGFVQIALDLALAGKLFDASSWSGIELEILGNNEQYNIHLRTADLIRPWQSYRQSFLADGRWRTVRLLFRDFKPYRTDKALDTTRLRRIGLVAIGRAFSADLSVGGLRYFT
jgi:Complex I intermediate-associated protein 30 (CIA30)